MEYKFKLAAPQFVKGFNGLKVNWKQKEMLVSLS